MVCWLATVRPYVLSNKTGFNKYPSSKSPSKQGSTSNHLPSNSQKPLCINGLKMSVRLPRRPSQLKYFEIHWFLKSKVLDIHSETVLSFETYSYRPLTLWSCVQRWLQRFSAFFQCCDEKHLPLSHYQVQRGWENLKTNLVASS